MKKKINWNNYFNRKPKKPFDNPLDLKKIFPNYFDIRIFRSIVILAILLLVFTSYTNDWHLKFNYIICPETSLTPCSYYNSSNPFDDPIILQIGESIGRVPNEHALDYKNRVILLVIFSFFFNHLTHYYKTGSFKIPIDKDRLKKLDEVFNNENKN